MRRLSPTGNVSAGSTPRGKWWPTETVQSSSICDDQPLKFVRRGLRRLRVCKWEFGRNGHICGQCQSDFQLGQLGRSKRTPNVRAVLCNSRQAFPGMRSQHMVLACTVGQRWQAYPARDRQVASVQKRSWSSYQCWSEIMKSPF